MALENMVSVKDASEDLANKYAMQVSKLGYNLSYGYIYDDKEPVIKATAQYTSWRRVFYKFGTESTQKKVRALIPATYEYNGKIFPVKFSVASIGRFL